jgi:hypothetical protein
MTEYEYVRVEREDGTYYKCFDVREELDQTILPKD